jgi:hypothetical protein
MLTDVIDKIFTDVTATIRDRFGIDSLDAELLLANSRLEAYRELNRALADITGEDEDEWS